MIVITFHPVDLLREALQSALEPVTGVFPFQFLTRQSISVMTSITHTSVMTLVTRKAVSYTHLDVYKRQRLPLVLMKINNKGIL